MPLPKTPTDLRRSLPPLSQASGRREGTPVSPVGLPALAAMVGLAGILGFATILRHEWWRDEAYTWLVVRESRSAGDLLARLGFNGHPRAYYLLAYALRALGGSPLALSFCNLAFALAAIALLVRSAPFPPLHKALFAFGLFPLYQYGVITRSYSIFLFLLFLYAHLKARWPTQVTWRLLCLGLLAQVHLMSLAIAGALLLLELYERQSLRTPWTARAWMAVGTAGIGLVIAAYQVLPRGASHVPIGTNVGAFFYGLANGYFPDFDRFAGKGQIVIGTCLYALSWVVVSPDRGALLRYAALTVPLMGISALIYSGYRWHHGFYFIAFLVALWLSGPPSRRTTRFLGLVLALHAAIGGFALAEDLRRPYSNGEGAARAIQALGLTGLPLLGIDVQTDTRGELTFAFQIDEIQPVLLYLQAGRAYDPVAGSFEAYWKHYAEPNYFTRMPESELVPRMRAITEHLQAPLVVVAIENGLPERSGLPPPLRRLASFPRPLDHGEPLGLYLFPLE